MNARLTPEREQEIRAARYQPRALSSADVDIDDLLAEVDRLRSALRGAADEVAELDDKVADLTARPAAALDAFRAEVLNEAADHFDRENDENEILRGDYPGAELRRLAAAASPAPVNTTNDETCQCRTDRDGDGEGFIRYQARDREFVTLPCRDHKGGAR